MIIVVMGVSGSGKTTIGTALAQRLGWRCLDADTLHSEAAIDAMKRGIPLTDETRAPWLAAVRSRMREAAARGEDLVVACSALKAKYRRALSDGLQVTWVYLKGPRELFEKRLAARQGHFMNAGMLDSQLAALEEPEDAITVDVTPPPGAIVDRVVNALPATDAAPPWDYNPSAWRERIPICVLAMVGFAISAWMALYQWRLVDTVWDPIWGASTTRVLDSDVSHDMQRWFGVPDAALGAIAYLGDAVFGLAGSTSRWRSRPWLVVLFGIDVIPLGAVSAILVVVQATVLGEWCFLCLVTATISMVLVYWAYDEVWSSLVYLWRVWQRTHSTRQVWAAFWGGEAEEAV